MGSTRRVFLSHTSELADYPKRQSYVDAAKDACNRDGFRLMDMSLMTASDQPPAELCRGKVRECGVYVGIIGFNYGSPVREEPDLSYTELEFEEAGNHGLRRLVFLAHKDAKAIGPDSRQWEHAARQAAFRQRLHDSGLTITYFRNPDQLQNLIGQALRDLDQRSTPFMARPASNNLVRRPESTVVCDLIRAEVKRADGGESGTRPPIVALVGPGGFGKTELADLAGRQLRDLFRDGGVLRVELGEKPSKQRLVGLCKELIELYDKDCPAIESVDVARTHLNRVLGGRRMLLLVDDLWRRPDLLPFLTDGSPTVLLITARDHDAVPDDATVIQVDRLGPAQSQQIVAHELDAQLVDWSSLVERTGGWPLLASLINGALRGEVRAGRDVAAAAAELSDRLAQRGPVALDPRNPAERREAIRATVQVSMSRLRKVHGKATATRFKDLAIFPEDAEVPLQLLARWWDVPLEKVRELAQAWRRHSLVMAYDARRATVRLHDVMRSYLKSEQAEQELRAHQATFLKASCPPSGRWADLPDDATYLWRWVAWHLHQAGHLGDLTGTVRDVAYLARKAHRVGTPAVLDDLSLAEDGRAGERHSWFRRWSHLLGDLPRADDVAATLLARPDVDEFLHTVEPQLTAPFMRYAVGWQCPEPADTQLAGVLGEHHRRVQACAWSPDGERLASVDGYGFVQVLSPGARAAPVELGDQEWNVTVAWSPDGRRLACGDDDGVVRVWTMDSKGPAVELGHHERGVRALAWSPDGKWVASGGDDTVRVWHEDGAFGLGELPPRAGWVRSLAWSPNGKQLLACAFDDGDVLVWAPMATRQPVRELGRHEGGAFAVTWSADGNQVISGGKDGAVWRWPVNRKNSPIELGRAESAVLALDSKSDGGQLAYGCDDGTLRTWTVDGAVGPANVGEHQGGVLTVAWQPGGPLLASGGRDSTLRLWRVEHGATGGRADRADDPVLSVAWSTDGRLACGTRDGVVRVWNAKGGGVSQLLSADGDAVGALAWSPDGMLLARGGADGQVRVWSVVHARDVHDLPAIGRGVRAIAWSPSRSDLAYVSDDGTVRTWRIDATSATELAHRGEQVRSLAWAPDGTRFATGGDDGRLQIWEALDWGEPVTVGHQAEHGVRAVAWSAAGLIACGHDDGTVWLWNPKRSAEPIQLCRHRDEVRDVVWSRDGSLVLSIGRDHVLRGSPAGDRLGSGLSCALALEGSLGALACHPASDRIAVAGSSGPYILEVVVS